MGDPLSKPCEYCLVNCPQKPSQVLEEVGKGTKCISKPAKKPSRRRGLHFFRHVGHVNKLAEGSDALLLPWSAHFADSTNRNENKLGNLHIFRT